MRMIYLSASQIINADDCRRKHWYASIARFKPAVSAANLAFGKCIDLATREYLFALTLNQPLPNTVKRFEELWLTSTKSEELTYAATHTPEQFLSMGMELMRQFPGIWEDSGYQVALDNQGSPLVDLKLDVDIGNGVILRGILDIVAYTPVIELCLLDEKTASAEHSEMFTRVSDQMTTYNILMDAHRERLGLPEVEKVGFLDLIKRKKTPEVLQPITVRRRNKDEIRGFIQKCHWLADDIRQGKFPKASRHAYNTPCDLCDFKGHCIDGNTDGLIIPKQDVIKFAAA